MDKKVKICKRCVLPETFPKISFNEEGICNYCLEYKKTEPDPEKEKKLEDIFNNLKKQNKPYHCLVPLSGGKDSAYVLYLIVKRYKLKPLAITLNNYFRTRIADKNLKMTLKKLDVDHIMVTPRWSIMKKLYKKFLENEGKGKFVSEFCIPCNIAIWSTVNKFSEIFKIPVIYGGVREIESSPPEIFGFSSQYFREIARDVLTEEEIKEFMPYEFDYKNASFDNELSSIWIFDYIYWRREDEQKALKEIGWNKGNNISEIHIDCSLHELCNYFHKKNWGRVRTALHYSKMIRRGDMTREEALKLLKKEEGKRVSYIKKYFMNRLEEY